MRSARMMLGASALATLGFVALPHGAAAQTPVKPAASQVITLGTGGGPLPRAGWAQSSNLLIVNGKLYLIDAGDGVTRRIVQAGVKFTDVGEIFITHNHSDHMGGLANLMNSEWEYARKAPINVYGPPGTESVVKGAMQYFQPNAEIRWAEGKRIPLAEIFVGHDMPAGVVYRDADVTVRAAENTHFHFSPDMPGFGRHKSYSYRFETPDRTIVFTGDTGPSDALAALAKGADILFTEIISVEDVKQARIKLGAWQKMTPQEQAGLLQHLRAEHLTPEDIADLANRAGVKTVVLTHLTPSESPDVAYPRWAAEVQKRFTGRVLVAKDRAKF